jgi:hypothetical protein
MNEKTRSAAGRVLSELYREDQERREEPSDSASERPRSASDEHEKEEPAGRAA